MNKCEHYRNISAVKFVMSHFRPVSHLEDIRFRQCFVWLGIWLIFTYTRMTKQLLNCKNIRHSGNMSHIRTSVPFWGTSSNFTTSYVFTYTRMAWNRVTVTPFGIQGVSHFRKTVPSREQQVPSYWSSFSCNTLRYSFLLTHTSAI